MVPQDGVNVCLWTLHTNASETLTGPQTRVPPAGQNQCNSSEVNSVKISSSLERMAMVVSIMTQPGELILSNFSNFK